MPLLHLKYFNWENDTVISKCYEHPLKLIVTEIPIPPKTGFGQPV